MRDLAIQILTGFTGGLIAVVLVSFVRNLINYIKRSMWEPW